MHRIRKYFFLTLRTHFLIKSLTGRRRRGRGLHVGGYLLLLPLHEEDAIGPRAQIGLQRGGQKRGLLRFGERRQMHELSPHRNGQHGLLPGIVPGMRKTAAKIVYLV